MNLKADKKFAAFISYSRKDKSIADWLHTKLESYELPKTKSTSEIFTLDSKYFRPVFLDTQDLHVEDRPFTEEIQKALKNSVFLIVLCSRHSAVSPFVNKEISYFLSTHDNNLSKIVPLFIDEVNGSIPSSFENTSIMDRHFPIYNSRLSCNSEANKYCFYQIISYILGQNFSEIYNRYEISENKKKKERRNILIGLIAFLTLVIAAIGGSYYHYRKASTELLNQKQLAIEFEKKVFPAAVVLGYEKNFLTPVINHLKDKGEKFKIYILMPTDHRDLTHQDRIGTFLYESRNALGIDSIPVQFLPTSLKRGSRIMRIAKDGQYLPGVYLDFASTTTSFLEIAEFKKNHESYSDTPIDSIIHGYAHEFVDQTNKKLKADSTFVKFVYSTDELISDLKELAVDSILSM